MANTSAGANSHTCSLKEEAAIHELYTSSNLSVMNATVSIADSLDEFPYNWSLEFAKYNGHIRLQTVDIVQYVDKREPLFTIGDLQPSQLAKWYQRSLPEVPRQTVSARLNLLLVSTNSPDASTNLAPEGLAIQTTAITQAFQGAKLPLSGLAAHILRRNAFVRMPSRSQNSDDGFLSTSTFYYTCPPWSITWSFGSSNRFTSAVLLYGTEHSSVKDWFVEELSRCREYIAQETLLGFIGIKLAFVQAVYWHSKRNDPAADIGIMTGRFEEAKDTIEPLDVDNLDLNYGAITGQLGALSGGLGRTLRHLRVAHDFTSIMIRSQKRFKDTLGSEVDKIVHSQAKELAEGLEAVHDYQTTWFIKMDETRNRLASELSSVHNLIAKKDSAAAHHLADDSRKLAVESKKDSSSTKTIAAVTMAFLPGTFVASIFAMPILDWNLSVGHNLKSVAFWTYWSVTIPLTLGTFVIWWAWLQYWVTQEKRTREGSSKAAVDNPYLTSVHDLPRVTASRRSGLDLEATIPSDLMPTLLRSGRDSVATSSSIRASERYAIPTHRPGKHPPRPFPGPPRPFTPPAPLPGE